MVLYLVFRDSYQTLTKYDTVVRVPFLPGVKQGRYTTTQRTSVILEVQKLRDQTSNGLATDPVNTHPGIQGDRQIKDGCELDCNIFHQDSQDDGTLSETSGGSCAIHSSSSSSNSPHIQDKEIVELAQEVGRTSIILGEESTKESGVPCLDKSEDILQRIMTGYGYLEHFTKSMTNEEIRDILDKEWVSIFIFTNISILFYCTV